MLLLNTAVALLARQYHNISYLHSYPQWACSMINTAVKQIENAAWHFEHSLFYLFNEQYEAEGLHTASFTHLTHRS